MGNHELTGEEKDLPLLQKNVLHLRQNNSEGDGGRSSSPLDGGRAGERLGDLVEKKREKRRVAMILKKGGCEWGTIREIFFSMGKKQGGRGSATNQFSKSLRIRQIGEA